MRAQQLEAVGVRAGRTSWRSLFSMIPKTFPTPNVRDLDDENKNVQIQYVTVREYLA